MKTLHSSEVEERCPATAFIFTAVAMVFLFLLAWMFPAALGAVDYIAVFACVFGIESIVEVAHLLRLKSDLPDESPASSTDSKAARVVIEYSYSVPQGKLVTVE